MERWPSGLRRTPGKRVEVNASPGFESPSLCHPNNSLEFMLTDSWSTELKNTEFYDDIVTHVIPICSTKAPHM